ncbi:hypothetical protein KR044_012731, partial [Drosophila immigrans]
SSLGGGSNLRLADLMNLDKNSCANMNVAEVAKNAIMLLSAYQPAPLDNVQQTVSQIQVNAMGFSNKLTQGADVNVNTELTDLPLYHRFN